MSNNKSQILHIIAEAICILFFIYLIFSTLILPTTWYRIVYAIAVFYITCAYAKSIANRIKLINKER